MCGEGCRRCWSRVPIAILITLIVYIISLTIYIGCILSVYQYFFIRYFNFAPLTGILIPIYLILLAVGVLVLIAMIISTGETRKQLCKAACCNWTGRIFQLFNIFIVSLLLFIFIIVSGVSILPNILFVVVVLFCKVGLSAKIASCDIFTEIGLDVKDKSLCDGSSSTMGDFCADSNIYLGRTLVAYIVTIIICMCLVNFLVCMTTNYVRLKYLAKYEESDMEMTTKKDENHAKAKGNEETGGNPFK